MEIYKVTELEKKIKALDILGRIYYNINTNKAERSNEMEDNIIILEDEHGCSIEFETIDVFEMVGITFFALLECMPEGQETDEVLIMKVEGDIDSEEAELVMVDDEELLQKAFNEFLRRDEEHEE